MNGKKVDCINAFDAEVAQEILDRVRYGATLVEVCEDPEFPVILLTAYDWLSDPKVKMSESQTFGQAYRAARRDQTMTWLDRAAMAYDNVKIRGRKEDSAYLAEARQRASLLVTMAKEVRMQLAATGSDGGDNDSSRPTVVVRTYTRDGEVSGTMSLGVEFSDRLESPSHDEVPDDAGDEPTV